MVEVAPDEENKRPPQWRRRSWRIGGGSVALIALAVGSLWVARKPIADHFIAQALKDRGIDGRYVIARIGPRTQRLEQLVLGDPKRPDLTVRWVEVDFGYNLFSARITGIRASGVRLRGRLHDGTLDLGSLNKLMTGSGGKAELPDMVAQLDDATLALRTEYGRIGLALDGRGNLRSGFAGTLGLSGRDLAAGGCGIERIRAPIDIASEAGSIILKGPLRVAQIDCAASRFSMIAPRLDLDVRSDLGLENIRAALSLSATEARQADYRLKTVSALVTAKGAINQLQGSAAIAAASAALGPVTSDAIKLGGNFAVRPQAKDQDYSYAGALTVENARPTDGIALGRLTQSVASTPVGPLARKLAKALEEAGKANRLTVSGRVSGEGSAGQLLANGLRFEAASGAKVALAPDSHLTASYPKGDWTLEGGLMTSGGGLPDAQIALTAEQDGQIHGTLRMEDYRAETARLGLTPVVFARAADGAFTIRTTVSLDGPIADGGIKGLVVPVDARMNAAGAVRLAGECTPLRWTSLKVSSLSLDPARVSLCGLGKDALSLRSVQLAGRIGDSPLRLSATSARYLIAPGRFDLAGLDVRIGAGENPVLMSATSLDGALDGKGGFAGKLAGANAVIGPVPLDLTEIAGAWRFAGGKLGLDGALRVTDRQTVARFNPMVVPDAHLTLANSRIDVTGTLAHEKRKANVAALKIRHELGSGTGQADFKLADLRFGNAIQPDDLTPMALGVVANVNGLVEGGGQIRWTGQGVTSTGTFSTREMSLAAAFGPVTGVATTIEFTDLLGMKTAPHQRVTMKQVSAGVDVFDGVLDYALLSNEQARVEGGRWPFSGGTLELLPATVELDAHKPRHFIFRLVGLDAGAFINTLQLENISATGTFDGLFPMIFDERGGRIEGGVLVARQLGHAPLIMSAANETLPVCDPTLQSGNLAYVGPVSNAQLGVMGKLAFDALKNLRYKCLTIFLDGALDGEFVTRVSVNGINQGTEEARKSFISRPFLGLPFIFNVRIEAPFRGLLNSAAGFVDPRGLIRSELDKQNQSMAKDGLAVQPLDSDKGLEGNRK